MGISDKPRLRFSSRRKAYRQIILIICFAVMAYAFLANSWVCDDAYITYRVSDNLVHGYGPVWNVGERVQAFTNPLWMFLIAAVHLFIAEIYWVGMIVSFVCVLAMLWVLYRGRTNLHAFLLLFLLLVSSKAFIDYTSSGLENPLTFLLLAVFFTRFIRDMKAGFAEGAANPVFYYLVASLAFVNRMDSILLYIPALIYIAVHMWRERKWRSLTTALIGFAPAIAWMLFSFFYYGFLLPNTFYAKLQLGLPKSLIFKQGIVYLAVSLAYDPITLIVVAIAFAMSLIRRGGWKWAAFLPALGAVIYVLYIIWIGGDFMSGRFLGAPFLLAALALTASIRGKLHWRRALPSLIALLAVYNLFMPLAPLKTTPAYEQAWDWKKQNGVHDERGSYHRGSNILGYDPMRSIFDRGMPDWSTKGIEFAMSDRKVAIADGIGFFGYYAGPEKYVIDEFALADPLLARLPVSGRFTLQYHPGHYLRDIPDGYVESVRQGKNLISDPALKEYYEGIRVITRGPLFSLSRFGYMWSYNVGGRRQFHYRENDTLFRIAATHERLRTYSGRAVARSVESTGRGGILLTGPGIPLMPGRYRVEWRGTVATSDGPVGSVDISTHSGRMVFLKQEVTGVEASESPSVIAALDFELKRSVDSIDFRFYVNEGVRMSLVSLTLKETEE